MSLVKRLFILLLALLTVLASASIPAHGARAETSGGASAPMPNSASEKIMRVGIYASTSYRDTLRFSSRLVCESGLELGYAAGNTFNRLFSANGSSVIILPSVNASVNLSGGTCAPSASGAVGAYAVTVSSHASASEARSRADRIGGFVAVTESGYEVRAFSANTKEASEKLSSGLPARANKGITVLDGATGKIFCVFEGKTLAVRGKGDAWVHVPTSSSSNYRYPGHFELSVQSGKLKLVNVLGLEDYVKCVMSVEVGMNYSPEMRKAFSLLIRTFGYVGKHSDGFSVCTTTCCQAYLGDCRMNEENNKVVDSTRGKIVTYNGAPIRALYHASNGGETCSSYAAWGSSKVPYLNAVEQEEVSGGYKWEKTYTQKELYEFLKSRKKFSSIKDDDISIKILGTDYQGSDYITLLSVSDGSGTEIQIKSAEGVRNAFGYKSGKFTVSYTDSVAVATENGTVEEREITGVLTADGYKEFDSFGDSYSTADGHTVSPDSVRIDGSGNGHGVGLSVLGAEQMAKDGHSYKSILAHYYAGVEVTPIY